MVHRQDVVGLRRQHRLPARPTTIATTDAAAPLVAGGGGCFAARCGCSHAGKVLEDGGWRAGTL